MLLHVSCPQYFTFNVCTMHIFTIEKCIVEWWDDGRMEHWWSHDGAWPQQHHVFVSSSLPLYPHSHVGDRGLIPKCDLAPLPNGRQQVSMSRVLRDNHYIQMSHVTVVVALKEPSLLIGQECRVLFKIWGPLPVMVTSQYE